VRYPQGGGLTAEQQAFRELIRMEAADRFAASEDSAVIAKVLRVHVRSVQRWRSAWDAGTPMARISVPSFHSAISTLSVPLCIRW
jgi:hypothetical protein